MSNSIATLEDWKFFFFVDTDKRFLYFQRSKKVFFDPSDIHIPTRKRGRPVGATNKNKDKDVSKSSSTATKVEADRSTCYICMNQGQDRRGQCEKLISCKDCTNKGNRNNTLNV